MTHRPEKAGPGEASWFSAGPRSPGQAAAAGVCRPALAGSPQQLPQAPTVAAAPRSGYRRRPRQGRAQRSGAGALMSVSLQGGAATTSRQSRLTSQSEAAASCITKIHARPPFLPTLRVVSPTSFRAWLALPARPQVSCVRVQGLVFRPKKLGWRGDSQSYLPPLVAPGVATEEEYKLCHLKIYFSVEEAKRR